MKRKAVFVLAMLAVFITGCVKDLKPPETPNDDIRLNLTEEERRFLSACSGGSHTVTINEATKRAEDAISFLAEAEGRTRSFQGVKRIKETGAIAYQKSTNTLEYYSLIHHNWGWDGGCNGYFATKSYDARDGMVEASNSTRADEYNFKYHHSFYYNIQP